MIVAFNATAYGERPSGARNRCVGLAAAVLRSGGSVRLYAPRGASLRTAVRLEHGGEFPEDRYDERPTPFDAARPAARAWTSRRWFDPRVPGDTDLFVTDYYPVLTRIPTVLTVHDLRYFAAREFEPAARSAWFRAVFPRAARDAARVATPTAAIGREVEEFVGIAKERIVVVPNGLSSAWRGAAPGAASGGHLLMVGFAERRKDLATVLAALRRTPSAPPLVVVGPGRPPRAAVDLVASGRVRFAGPVDDAALVELCRDAAALVHPSRYEGFGMPVIEAMSVGTPVIAARCPAVEEVAGGLATLVAPGDVDGWAVALASTAAASPAARERARRFTWDAAAARLGTRFTSSLLPGADSTLVGGDGGEVKK